MAIPIKHLSKIPLFENISCEKIPDVLKHLDVVEKSYTKDTFIRTEGDCADFIGIVVEGTVHVLQYDYMGNRNITASFSAGDMFAEAISCAGIKSIPFSIMAVSDCRIIFINVQRLFENSDSDNDYHDILISNLLRIVSRKNMLLNQKLHYMSHKTTAEKLLSYLDDQSKLHQSNEFVTPFDRQALADFLGVERSAMSAEISKLPELSCYRAITRDDSII